MNIIIIFGIIGISLLGYLIFPRQTKNLMMKILGKYRKRYVVCHLKYSSGVIEDFLVVPNLQGLTQVSNYSYLLEEKYSICKYKGRLHFNLIEANAIPELPASISTDDIVFQAAEIQTALDNRVMEYLFSKRKELMFMIIIIIAIISCIALIYNIIKLDEINTFMRVYINQSQTIQVVP